MLFSLQDLGLMMLIPLLLTVVVETPIVAIAARGTKASWQVGLLVNTLTNPIAVLLFLAVGPEFFQSYDWLGWVLVGAIEVSVVVVEALIFRRVLGWSARKSFVVSLVANLASFGLGFGAFSWGF